MKVSVPFNQKLFKEFRLFVVPVLVENQGQFVYLPMIVDSGASYVAVRPDVFEQLAISPLRYIPLVTASERAAVPLGRVDKITVGSDCSAENIDVISISLPEILPAEGLLGASFFNHFPVFMDFKEGILELDR